MALDGTPSPSVVGSRAELEVARALVLAGYDVFVPLFSAHSRIDLVACRPGEAPLRVQCKSARRRGGVVEFRAASHTGGGEQPYVDEIDAFGVWAPDPGAAYLVPLDHVRGRMCHLRLEPCANGQASGVRWAADFVLGRS